MARPREFDRDVALATAQEAFWAQGYEGTSISDLVSALGLAPARIYAAFGSKEELFREAVALYEANEGSFVATALAQESTARQAVTRMLSDAIEIYTRPGKPKGCLVVSAAVSSAPQNDAVREFLSQRRCAQEALIADRLKRARNDGDLSPATDADALATTISTLLVGISMKARDGASRERLQKMSTFAVAAMFGSPE